MDGRKRGLRAGEDLWEVWTLRPELDQMSQARQG